MRIFIIQKAVVVFISITTISSVPFVVHGKEGNTVAGFATTVGELLNPDKWFEILKKNISFPITKKTEVKVPTPEEALDEASSTLRDINKDIREEVGIDFAKFFGWFAKVLKVFFQIIVNLFEAMSKTLTSE